MNEENKIPVSRMSRGESVAALVWLPVHLLLLPLALVLLFPDMGEGDLNFWVYAGGAAVLVLLCRRFLRRDFDTLCERFGWVLMQVLVSYGAMMLANMAVGTLLELLLPEENPNNQAVMEVYRQSGGKIAASTVLLAPLVEELMFRAGLFGLLRRANRTLAYVACILLFAAYHVWPYAVEDPRYWLYILQYVPATYLLCRIYERTETVWAGIFLHMLVNAVSLWALSVAGSMGL